ncbi:MAG TPA: methyltransferase domain-containing protein [Salinisphaeraceae bacterium]|nr:methyltransferase domain-containing protein [Salinisphaeraceae bacterium]
MSVKISRLHDTSCEKQLRDWLAGPRTRLLMQREQALLRPQLAQLTGYRLLQVGTWGYGPELLRHAGTLCQWRLAQWPGAHDDACFDGMNLPIASGSIDALLLAHSLELAAEPHHLLRECERVLSDRGQLILVGFNARSVWALAQRLPGHKQGRYVRSAQLFVPRRACDWLRLLGLEPELLVRYGVGFPLYRKTHSVTAPRQRRRPAGISSLAQAYIVVARKRVVPLTRLHWRKTKAAKGRAHVVGLAHHGLGRVDSGR